MTRTTLPDDISISIEHSWNWFSVHAAQRLQMLNFWIVSVAFLTAGYVSAINGRRFSIAIVVALGGAALSFLFRRLELRTQQLVRLAERPLRHLQAVLAGRTGIHDLNIIEAADRERALFTSYGQVIAVMHLLVIGAFLAGAIYGASRA